MPRTLEPNLGSFSFWAPVFPGEVFNLGFFFYPKSVCFFYSEVAATSSGRQEDDRLETGMD